ncbi:BMP family ABC transporter substrate-binding protein [Pseudoflavonifractor phocaeensis]|uniref:BMP family ABC transporter substrate-binding protein n=1 Tax=Pseudoflavonifractor phocaeensis TaxID=1870988 RepID=UPI001F1E625F|nr:BMP family ABC transporter substrate-binding protein [Pseudoflavonifractor phocaeensis]MCF2595540.1 BMP family ABC transporter substrate-binding protein [Pseudoflavonifractor phocaeensis]
MPTLYYKDAQKLGQKEFRACTAKGLSPYLPVLDDLVPAERMFQGMDLGVVQVPMEFLVGTRSRQRTEAFARNFMPLLPEESEFAKKWQNLCQSHLEKGIRDPIKAYEYMNRFYVEEGNKRVSVLKFFGADTVYAQVTRILPERNGQKDVELYYEFLEFYRLSKVNFIEFSKLGSFSQLQRLLGKGPEEPWTDEDRSGFSTAYYYFRQAYEANGGKRLSSTVGDAMLAYIKIYGYPSLRSRSAAEIKKAVARVWEDITLQQEETPIDVKLIPEEETGGGLLSKVFKSKTEVRKAAFIHDKNQDTSGWTFGHELGRQHVQRVFQGELETTAYFNALDGDPLQVIERAIADGNTTIFTTSPRLLPASLRAAVDHPECVILNCSLNKSHRYIRTYYARMYEVKFIIGAIAGSLAGSNPVGYICDYPIFGQMAGINAFALGVQLVNPRVKVYLEWSAVDGVAAAAKRLTDRGIRLISSQDLAKREDGRHSSFGLSLINEDGQVPLAMPVWQWGVYYESMLRRIQSKSFQLEYEESSKALNYYWGMSAGVVDLRCSDRVPDGSKKLASLLREGICAGLYGPFQGPLYAQGGRLMAKKGQSLSLEQIINMDWLVENIEGSIPVYEELNDTGKATVGIVGIDLFTEERQSSKEPMAQAKEQTTPPSKAGGQK